MYIDILLVFSVLSNFMILFLYYICTIAIATAAIEMLAGDTAVKMSRKPDIMADAAYLILTQDSRSSTGKFLIDDEVLKEHGVTDMDQYANAPGIKLDVYCVGLGTSSVEVFPSLIIGM